MRSIYGNTFSDNVNKDIQNGPNHTFFSQLEDRILGVQSKLQSNFNYGSDNPRLEVKFELKSNEISSLFICGYSHPEKKEKEC